MKLIHQKTIFLFITCLLTFLHSQCSQSAFQTILYNSEYLADNESASLSVDPNFGIIPIDEVGRPNEDFHMDLYEYPNHPRVTADDDNGFLPQINVSWYEARDACLAVGKRLCSVYEWREACYSDGVGGRKEDIDSTYLYPYESEYQADICVTETSSTAVVGSRPGCKTSLGQDISDLSGNVWEWVNHDFYGQGDEFEDQQAIVGGFYFSGRNAKCKSTLILNKETKNEIIGFRCCRDKDTNL